MATKQSYIVRGMQRHPLTMGAGIREQASRLPNLYAMRDQQAYQEGMMGIEEGKLNLGQQQLTQQKEQFKFQKEQMREEADVAKGGAMLSGGIGIGKMAASRGVFDERLKQFGLIKPTTQTQLTSGVSDDRTSAAFQSQRGPQRSSFQDFKEGGWGSGAWGGLSGGLTGAGLAKSLGAKKKWQTMAAGAAGGLFSTWMAGSDNPWSMALGGALGAGVGALF